MDICGNLYTAETADSTNVRGQLSFAAGDVYTLNHKVRCTLILLTLVIVLNAGCKDEQSMNYTFEVTNDLSLITYSSKILNILDISDFASNYGEKCVKIQGQLLSLFGEPAYTTPNLENAYFYVITTTNAEGRQYILTAYDGSSGPAVKQ